MTEAHNVPRHAAAKRIALGIATALVSVNIWTGSPLLALWVGSKAVGSSGLSREPSFLWLASSPCR